VSGKYSERQSAEICREKNLIGRALKLEETGAVTIGARRGRFYLVPPARTRCREPIQVRIDDALRASPPLAGEVETANLYAWPKGGK
jgi:hypothetical protein